MDFVMVLVEYVGDALSVVGDQLVLVGEGSDGLVVLNAV